jgi:hypothetical protein
VTDAHADVAAAADGPSPLLAAASFVSVFQPTPPAIVRSRVRLALIAVALGLWLLPWLGDQTGPALTGAPAALAFLAAWGFAATALVAKTRRGLLVGEALTSAALAGSVAALVALHHPWLPGPDRTSTCLPIFLPLAALGLLDAVSRLRRPPLGNEIAAIRAGTALLCAAALFVALDGLPSIVALALAVAPASVAFPDRAKTARRAIELLVTCAGVALFLDLYAQELLVPTRSSVGADEVKTVWAFLHPLLALAIVVYGGWGVMSPEAEPDAPPASPPPTA